jgi:membrane fusion protein (multidrug efflux system)
MFVQARVDLGAGEDVVVLPASSIGYAPYGDSVFVVETRHDGKGASQVVHQRFVKLGASRGDQVAVLSGIAAGDEVVTSGVFKLRNNGAVLVNNTVQPSNNASPTVEDR